MQQIFDDWARRGRADTMAQSHEPNARRAFDRLELGTMASDARGSRYLDVGCGVGYTVRWAAAEAGVAEAIGIDLAPDMIKRAKVATGALDAKVRGKARFFAASLPDHGLENAGLLPRSFDAIFSMEMLYYVPDLPSALAQIATLLRPGGRFACVVDYYAENRASHGWPEALGCTMTLLSESQWSGAFEAAGLVVTEQTRLRQAPPEITDPARVTDTWQVTEGSLFTLCVRPL